MRFGFLTVCFWEGESRWLICIRHDRFIVSAAGQEIQKRLYNETMVEMGKYVGVPSSLGAKV